MCGFYKQFIRNFSDICHSLNRLTADHVPFVWDIKCQKTFEILKEMLISKPILSFPNWNKPFQVECDDASKFAVGGVIQ